MTGAFSPGSRLVLALAALIAPVALADDARLRLQGLFCNTEDQLDGALANFDRVRSFTAAAEIANVDEVVCTYVDALHYLIDAPVEIAGDRGGLLLPRYRGRLVGVFAGDRLRPVSPPVEVHFVTPGRLAGAVVERRS